MKELHEIESSNELSEPKYKYTNFGVWGKIFKHKLYDKYRDEIDPNLELTEPKDEKIEKDIIETLKFSLENKKDFYTNAKPYMKEMMKDYEKALNEDIKF